MILSTQTDRFIHYFGYEEAVRMVAQAGFDAVDLSMMETKDGGPAILQGDWRANAAALKATAEQCGVFFNQAHAPFPTSKLEPGFNETVFDLLVRALEVGGILGVRAVVVHPMHHLHWEDHAQELKERNMEFYRSLAPYAKKAGVKIALENMWQRGLDRNCIVPSVCASGEEFVDYLDTLADDVFTACLDLGHCGLAGYQAPELIRALGSRLGALHVHDNDYVSDRHNLPYLGGMHWEQICQALADVGYAGDFTFEADEFYRPFDKALYPAGARFMCSVGRHLIAQIEACKG